MNSSSSPRAAFFVDGFNLYHSLCSAGKVLPDKSLKWLDLQALFKSCLYVIDPTARLTSTTYFTAYAHHLAKVAPEKITRHQAYVRALTATGVNVVVNQFKSKDAWDSRTGTHFLTHEEKETDVAMACAILEGAALNQFDAAVIVSGDTDLRPVVGTFTRLHPDKRLLFAFPFDRKNRELARLVPASFSIGAELYAKHQFPDRVRLPSGKFVHRPKEWLRG